MKNVKHIEITNDTWYAKSRITWRRRMEREIIKKLKAWKDNPDRKPLILTGVRQCGKTYAMKDFGEMCFEDVAYFNFEGDEGLQSIFDYNLKTERILEELGQLYHGKPLIPGKTLVIFDEIQACPRAVTSLKYFCEENRKLHLICAGSLLGVALKREHISFPVGKVDHMQMYPMSFSEFLQAENPKLHAGVQHFDFEKALPAAYTEPLSKLQRIYYAVGGMPEAVAAWIESHDFEKVERIQDNILIDYRSDFSKHAPIAEVPKITWVWDAIPAQLAKDNHKFIFSHVKQGARAKDLEDALQWLVDAGLAYRLELVEKPELPLSFCANKTNFKVYLSDVGLLRRKSGVSAQTILQGTERFNRFKGALTENYVMTELLVLGKQPYFWKSGNTAELDFLIEDGEKLIPIESKAEVNTKAKSYRLFCNRYQPELGFRCSMKNIGEHFVERTYTYSLPLYLLWRMNVYLGAEIPALVSGNAVQKACSVENYGSDVHLQEQVQRMQHYMEQMGVSDSVMKAFEEFREKLK